MGDVVLHKRCILLFYSCPLIEGISFPTYFSPLYLQIYVYLCIILFFLLLCAHMCSKVMHLVTSVCVQTFVYIYMYVIKKLFSAFPLENPLLSITYCLLFENKRLLFGLLRPASCSDGTIHAFHIRHKALLALKYFLLSFNGTPHPLG